MKARKLISRQHIDLLYNMHQVGIPLARVMRDNDIEMSLPSFKNLLDHLHSMYLGKSAASISTTIEQSLFPEWLTPGLTGVQEQPDDWRYVGRFPMGVWARR